jgi:putative membrane protein
LLGIAVGIIFGVIPGLHPNFLIIVAPLMLSFFSSTENLIGFVVAMAVSNAISDFISSILFGAPEQGTELSVTPGHRMLLAGHGYQAVKLAVMGGLFSIVFVCVLFPAVAFIFPFIYKSISPFLFFVLIVVSLYMIFSERAPGKIIAAFICFGLAGIVGISLNNLSLNPALSLFPVLSGLFASAVLIVQFRRKPVKIPRQKPDEYVSPRLVKRSVIFGSVGGIFSGLLPGVGTSQIASLATVDKNEKSFLVTIGAIGTSNIIISIISLWLIGKTRSGVALIISGFESIDFYDVVLVLFVALLAGAIAASLTLKLARIFLGIIEKADYSLISKFIFSVILLSVIITTGLAGVILFAVCSSIGIFAYMSGIKMSCLMGVLLLPTIIFYFPF